MSSSPLSETERRELLPRIFPDIAELPSTTELITRYPKRPLPSEAMVVRVAPSPTGFMHVGVLYTALINYSLAKQSGGVFILRVEDTDSKREVAGAIDIIVDSLNRYGLIPDEGYVRGTGGYVDLGEYGPYLQSNRRPIYRAFAAKLFLEGHAYPCFCSEEELNALREQQSAQKIRTGYYGRYAKWRHATRDEITAALDQKLTSVLRLRSPGDPSARVEWQDAVKGRITIPQNDRDEVILKSDGLTTYHFAHAVDDHLMGTTHVIRSDEWISSVPLHIQLFEVLGWEHPVYAHLSPIQKLDMVTELNAETGVQEQKESRRKLSKRKDPEANVEYFREQGYALESVLEYLTNVANSDFEDWRKANPTAPRRDFVLKMDRLSTSGALCDMEKLASISRDVLSRFPAEAVYGESLAWARDFRPTLAALLLRDPVLATRALNIERGGERPSKRLTTWVDVEEQVGFFFDDWFENLPVLPFPEQISAEDRRSIIEGYLAIHDQDRQKDAWFDGVKLLAGNLGFAPEVKLFRKNPQSYKGHVGDVSMVLRVAICGAQKTPDLWEVMQVLGNERVVARLKKAL